MRRAVTGRGRVRGVLAWWNDDRRIGAAVAAAVVLALVATAILYAHPPGRRKVSFETTDVSAISVGQDVRVAGVSVGAVSDVSLETDSVRVTLDVEKDVRVGTESRVDVRMLTPVGGYAITLVPMGGEPLGDRPIPAAQVTVPYSIGDVLQAAPKVTEEVDAANIDANLHQVADALQSDPDSIGSMISGMTSLARVMNRQREQVQTITALASEYLTGFNADRDMVFHTIREMDLVLSTYNTNHAGFNEAYRLLGHILMTVAPFEEYYVNHSDELGSRIAEVRTTIEDFNATMGPAIDALTAARESLAGWLTPQGIAEIGGGSLMASDICLPVPGREC